MTETDDVIKAAMGVAKDAAEGKITAAELDAELVTACRALFGTVAGPDDPLWTLHIDVTRQTLAAGGLSVAELAEWTTVLRRRSGAVEPTEALEASGLSAMYRPTPFRPRAGSTAPKSAMSSPTPNLRSDRE